MAECDFTTIWRLDAPIQAVWDAIYHSERWPKWWQAVERVVELKPGDSTGLGAVQRFTWKGRLPYRLRFDMCLTRIEPLVVLEGVASGDLEGTGIWRFASEGSLTRVRYDWRVRATRNWINWLAPLARPLFEWNHDFVMQQGALGLAHLLNARLVQSDDHHKEGDSDV